MSETKKDFNQNWEVSIIETKEEARKQFEEWLK